MRLVSPPMSYVTLRRQLCVIVGFVHCISSRRSVHLEGIVRLLLCGNANPANFIYTCSAAGTAIASLHVLWIDRARFACRSWYYLFCVFYYYVMGINTRQTMLHLSWYE